MMDQLRHYLATKRGWRGSFSHKDLEKFGRLFYDILAQGREPPPSFDGRILRLLATIVLEFTKDPSKYLANLSSSQRFIMPIIRPPEGCEQKPARHFEYKALPTESSIRLLQLHSIQRFECHVDLFQPIKCSIITVDLQDKPSYDAMSYTWGDPLTLYNDESDVSSKEAWSSPAFEIHCDGHPVTVSTSLYTMLIAVRSMMYAQQRAPQNKNIYQFTRHLWIDALCIDQSDMDERGSQVLMMGEIYSQAHFVVVWLGGGSPDALNAMQNLVNIERWLAKYKDSSLLEGFKISDKKLYETMGIPEITMSHWAEIYMFLNRSWFRRAWIVQEAARAKDIVLLCGSATFDKSVIHDALGLMEHMGWLKEMRMSVEPRIRGSRSGSFCDDEEPFVTGRSSRHIYRAAIKKIKPEYVILSFRRIVEIDIGSHESSLPLWKLLWNFRSCEATDPRDKVYALMGLSREFIQDGKQIMPRYERPVEEVYLGVATFLASLPMGLDFLCLNYQASPLKLPSWAPDYSEDALHFGFLGDHGPEYVASRGLSHVGSRVEGLELLVSGIRCGKLVHRGNFRSQDIDGIPELLEKIPGISRIWQPPKEHLKEICDLKSSSGSQHPTREGWTLSHQSRLEVLSRVVMLDLVSGSRPDSLSCTTAMKIVLQQWVSSLLKVSLLQLAASREEQLSNSANNSTGSRQTDLKAIPDAPHLLQRLYRVQQILTGKLPYGTKTALDYPPHYKLLARSVEGQGPFTISCEHDFAEMIGAYENLYLRAPKPDNQETARFVDRCRPSWAVEGLPASE